jgi:hypothetical protein
VYLFDHLSGLVFRTNEKTSPQFLAWPLLPSCFSPVLSTENSEECVCRPKGWSAQPAQDSLDLRGVHLQIGFGPNQVIGAGRFRFHRPLSLEALLDLFGRPTARLEPLLLCGGGTSDTDGQIQLGFCLSFEQERDHDDG